MSAPEREGTAEDFAALLGGGAKPDTRDVVAAVHPPDQDAPQPSGDSPQGKGASPLSPNQARAGTEFNLPDAVACRLQGEDYTEVEADARSIVDALEARAEADVPAHVRLAKAAIEAAKNNPNAAELMALSQPKRGARSVVDALHPEPEDEKEAGE